MLSVTLLSCAQDGGLATIEDAKSSDAEESQESLEEISGAQLEIKLPKLSIEEKPEQDADALNVSEDEEESDDITPTENASQIKADNAEADNAEAQPKVPASNPKAASATDVDTESGTGLDVVPKSCDLAAIIEPLRLKYRATYRGISVTSERQLRRQDDGSWRFGGEASLLFVTLREFTRFNVDGDRLRPISYRYERDGLGSSRDLKLSFDWQNKTVSNSAGDKKWSRSLVDNEQDLLSHQEQLRFDLLCGGIHVGDIYEYPIARGKRDRLYRYQVKAQQTLNTPMGYLRTLVVEKLEDDDQVTRVWLAVDWQFVIVKLEHKEGDDPSQHLDLLEGEVNGVAIDGVDETSPELEGYPMEASSGSSRSRSRGP